MHAFGNRQGSCLLDDPEGLQEQFEEQDPTPFDWNVEAAAFFLVSHGLVDTIASIIRSGAVHHQPLFPRP